MCERIFLWYIDVINTSNLASACNVRSEISFLASINWSKHKFHTRAQTRTRTQTQTHIRHLSPTTYSVNKLKIFQVLSWASVRFSLSYRPPSKRKLKMLCIRIFALFTPIVAIDASSTPVPLEVLHTCWAYFSRCTLTASYASSSSCFFSRGHADFSNVSPSTNFHGFSIRAELGSWFFVTLRCLIS